MSKTGSLMDDYITREYNISFLLESQSRSIIQQIVIGLSGQRKLKMRSIAGR